MKHETRCDYCKKIVDVRKGGSIFGPHDHIFMCIDCEIKETILRIKNHEDHLKILQRNKIHFSLQPERSKREDLETGCGTLNTVET